VDCYPIHQKAKKKKFTGCSGKALYDLFQATLQAIIEQFSDLREWFIYEYLTRILFSDCLEKALSSFIPIKSASAKSVPT
jgi:hypothetical protein